MHVFVLGDDANAGALIKALPGADYRRITSLYEAKGDITSPVFIMDELFREFDGYAANPLFINSVNDTLHELKAPPSALRFNGWPGFMQRDTWEISGDVTSVTQEVFAGIGKKFIAVKDEPGFVSARVISMIVNEAFFALGENISSKEDIDTALKLGTNYPFGPFEWCGLIGIHRIHSLLEKLARADKLYAPAPELIKQLTSDGPHTEY